MLENFHVMSINVPEDDISYVKLKEAKDLAASVKIAGRDIYQMERSFDVLDKAAANEGGNGMVAMGTGLGVGFGVGGQMAQLAGHNINTNMAPPPLPQTASYFVAFNGQQYGPYDMDTIKTYIANGQIQKDTLVWKQGMPSWVQISSLSELSNLFGATPPPLP